MAEYNSVNGQNDVATTARRRAMRSRDARVPPAQTPKQTAGNQIGKGTLSNVSQASLRL